MPNTYDIVVIGAGTGGYVAAIRAAQLGLTVAVVERQAALGGTCLLWGCIPTKALLEHAHALKVVQQAKEWGVTIQEGSVGINMDQVQTRKDRVVTGLTKGIEFLFKKNKIAWIRGTAKLAGNGSVEVVDGDRQRLTATREVIIATGSAPRTLAGIAIDHQRIITSDEAINLRQVPKSLAIIGSGAVGVEFASIFRRFGSDVTVFEALPRIVPAEDEQVSLELAKAFRKQGITCHTGSRVTQAEVVEQGVAIQAQLADTQSLSLTVECLLVATGRRPVTEGLGIEALGITLDRGYVPVNQRYQTVAPGVSAIGDVITIGSTPHPQLAHVSSAEGIYVAERIAGRQPPPINYEQVPSCTYCDPEIGSVGLTEREARDRGHDVVVGTFPFGVLGRAKIAHETDGFVKIVADRKYDELLGVHMIGPRATELVAEATLALRLESTVEELLRTIHAHPTMSEAVGEAAHAVHGGAIHS